jgi:hypothetical protein
LQAIRRVRAEKDMPASEVVPQIPAPESGKSRKTITRHGDLFTRRQSVAGNLLPEKSFLCNFLWVIKSK